MQGVIGGSVDRSRRGVRSRQASGAALQANVRVKNGAARFEIPFALNDAGGAWRIRAHDAVSGLTAESTVVRKEAH